MIQPRTALVTGANRGIGFEIARRLAAEPGMRVLVGGRSARTASEAAHALSGVEGAAVIGVALDLSDPQAAEARAVEIEVRHGPVDILVNNAGVMAPGDALEADLREFNTAMRVNAAAPYALTRIFGAAMKRRGWGRVVNISSGIGSFAQGLDGPAAYAISKAALNAVTVQFARALGPQVKVNCCCPGWVRTRMGGEDAPRTPQEAADTPVWLAMLADDGPTGGFFRDRKPIAW
ncbi:SDR family NAD(P)-dependent oxidoreductase [Maricaulaceae bacterium MS644]